MNTINGDFKIQMEPQTATFKGLDETKIGRISFRKTYIGALEAVGVGEMLSAQCADGHAGYVAIEQIKGAIAGRKGSFIIQHFGIKNPAHSDLRIEIIPGSGSGELVTVRGQMTIRTEGKHHHYELTYSLD